MDPHPWEEAGERCYGSFQEFCKRKGIRLAIQSGVERHPSLVVGNRIACSSLGEMRTVSAKTRWAPAFARRWVPRRTAPREVRSGTADRDQFTSLIDSGGKGRTLDLLTRSLGSLPSWIAPGWASLFLGVGGSKTSGKSPRKMQCRLGGRGGDITWDGKKEDMGRAAMLGLGRDSSGRPASWLSPPSLGSVGSLGNLLLACGLKTKRWVVNFIFCIA